MFGNFVGYLYFCTRGLKSYARVGESANQSLGVEKNSRVSHPLTSNPVVER